MGDRMRVFGAVAAAVVAALLATPGGAQPAQGLPSGAPPPSVATRDLASAPAGAYMIDLAHSSVIARVLHTNTSYSTLRFGVTRGVLDWNPAAPDAIKLDVTVDTKPYYAPIVYRFTPDSGMFLNTAKFPAARFVSTAVRPTGPARANVEGQLTFMGVTKPVVIAAELVGVGKTAQGGAKLGFTGVMPIKWSDFSTALIRGSIGDDMTVVLDAEFARDG